MEFHLPHFGGHKVESVQALAGKPETEPMPSGQSTYTEADHEAELASRKAAEKWGVANDEDEPTAQPTPETAPVTELPATEPTAEAEPQAPADTDHQISA